MRPQLPDYGTFTHWPTGGTTLIHPDDIAIVTRVIPSNRVFRRSRHDGVFYHYSYGSRIRFRLRPCMWRRLEWEGFDINDQVEVIGVGMSRELFVARIREIRFHASKNRIEYQLSTPGLVQTRSYLADELRNLDARPQLRPRDG